MLELLLELLLSKQSQRHLLATIENNRLEGPIAEAVSVSDFKGGFLHYISVKTASAFTNIKVSKDKKKPLMICNQNLERIKWSMASVFFLRVFNFCSRFRAI